MDLVVMVITVAWEVITMEQILVMVGEEILSIQAMEAIMWATLQVWFIL